MLLEMFKLSAIPVAYIGIVMLEIIVAIIIFNLGSIATTYIETTASKIKNMIKAR